MYAILKAKRSIFSLPLTHAIEMVLETTNLYFEL